MTSDKMIATRNEITRYIPQRNPIVMIHDLVEAGEDFAVTRLVIEADNIFVSEGCLLEPGLVENIAQTAAAQVGYQCALKNIPVPLGYIAAIKDLEIFSRPKQNSAIVTSVRIVNQVLNVTIIEGKVEQEGKLMCSCEMKIFIQEPS